MVNLKKIRHLRDPLIPEVVAKENEVYIEDEDWIEDKESKEENLRNTERSKRSENLKRMTNPKRTDKLGRMEEMEDDIDVDLENILHPDDTVSSLALIYSLSLF